jgi:hypothetical protein
VIETDIHQSPALPGFFYARCLSEMRTRDAFVAKRAGKITRCKFAAHETSHARTRDMQESRLPGDLVGMPPEPDARLRAWELP